MTDYIVLAMAITMLASFFYFNSKLTDLKRRVCALEQAYDKEYDSNTENLIYVLTQINDIHFDTIQEQDEHNALLYDLEDAIIKRLESTPIKMDL